MWYGVVWLGEHYETISWSIAGSGDTESKFGKNFGFALFRQGSVLFARFLPVFAHFLPENGQKMGKNGQIRFRLFLPKFARICSLSFVVRMRRSLLPGLGVMMS